MEWLFHWHYSHVHSDLWVLVFVQIMQMNSNLKLTATQNYNSVFRSRTIASKNVSPVAWCWIICWLHLCRRVRPPPPTNEYPGYDIKLSAGEALVLELWEIWSIPSLSLLPGSLWLEMMVPVRASFMGQIELHNQLTAFKQMCYVE